MKATPKAFSHAAKKNESLSIQEFSFNTINSEEKKAINLAATGLLNKFSVKEHSYLLNTAPPPPLDRVSTTYVPTSTPLTSNSSLSPQTWFFSFDARELYNTTARIQLTAIEALLIQTLTLSTERICSKQELIIGIGKDPHTYSGLEMCLSRLQNKFRDSFYERLFRSVRNKGYCLVQDVKNAQ